MNLYPGGCLCGACRYVITGEKPEAMYFCHCSRCRKETGTIHAANIFFNKAHLAWEQGQNNIAHFKLKGTQKQRAFCMTCGSPLPRVEDSCIVLPAGTLDDNNTVVTATAHIFYGSRALWEDKLANLKRFDELPDR